MTEEQQGGSAPEPEAAASMDQPPENRVAAVAVADDPATGEALTAPDAGEVADESESAPAGDPATAPQAATTADLATSEEQTGNGAADSDAAATTDVAATDAAPEVGDAPDTAETATAGARLNGSIDLGDDETAAAPAAADEEEVAPPRRELGPEPTTMEELLAEQDSEIKSFKPGDVVEGRIVRIDKDEMLVDIGAKSEGVVSNRELYGRNAESQPQLTVGDTVLVYVLQPESQEGHVVLSLRRAGLERKWRSMQEQFEAGVIIEAPVIDHNKGGLIVDCGIRGFVPISQIVDFPRRPQNDQPRDAAQEIAEKLMPFVGRKLRLKILEVNRKANRLILSEKVALYEERREKRDELFSSLQVGQKVTGTVRSIAPFGVFIDLGGIDGLVHKSELSWNKVNNPEAGYKVGDEVEAEVIDINHERGRISLSIRRLQPDPWNSTVADFNVGDVIDGTVTKLVNFGAFVRVRDGLEGLIHISELSHQRVAHPGDVVHEGQNLKLKIISLDSERHRLGLSLKQAEEPPARPAPEPGQPRERRPRPERAWAPSDAVQEPEGGIDNTLAAAFAQVREQVAASEAARTDDDVVPAAEAATVADDAVAPDTAVAEPGTGTGSAEPESVEGVAVAAAGSLEPIAEDASAEAAATDLPGDAAVAPAPAADGSVATGPPTEAGVADTADSAPAELQSVEPEVAAVGDGGDTPSSEASTAHVEGGVGTPDTADAERAGAETESPADALEPTPDVEAVAGTRDTAEPETAPEPDPAAAAPTSEDDARA